MSAVKPAEIPPFDLPELSLETFSPKSYHGDKFCDKQMLIGYARVSTADQNTDLQLDALQAAGCDKVFVEKASGAQRERPELQAACGQRTRLSSGSSTAAPAL